MTTVSFVIPSRGRDSLRLAVRSAARQEDVDVEIVVVDSSGKMLIRESEWSSSHVVVARTATPAKAGGARALGTSRASGEWIAYLDDDDISSARRLTRQISALNQARADVCTTGYVEVPYRQAVDMAAGDLEFERLFADLSEFAMPKVQPGRNDDLISYLFRRESLADKKRIVTSSIVVRAELAKSTPWDIEAGHFEDWRWLTECAKAGATWAHVPEPLVAIAIGAPNSLSAAPTAYCPEDLMWAQQLLETRPRELGDLFVCGVGVAALKAGDIQRGLGMLRAGRRLGKPGGYAMARFVLELVRSAVTGGR